MTAREISQSSKALVLYQPRRTLRSLLQSSVDEVYRRSMETARMDAQLLHPTIGRECILVGDRPRPTMGQGLPTPYPGTRKELLSIIEGTVHETINGLDYNALRPYLKTLKQLQDGSSFMETTIDSRNEEPGTTCVGISYALLKQLQKRHGIEGMLAVQRMLGQYAFNHAAAIIECSDGYVLLDPRNDPTQRIFSIPFGQKIVLGPLSLSAGPPGSMRPISGSLEIPDEEENFEYCTNIANGDDLVMKHFMVWAPFFPAQNPAFPIFVYDPSGRVSKTIYISLLQAKITLKNMNLPKEDPERTIEISFPKIREGRSYGQLKRFYDTGSPTFHTPLDELHGQLVTFVANAEVINQLFRDVHCRFTHPK